MNTNVMIVGTVKRDEAEEALADISKEKLEIISRTDSGVETVLFSGMIHQVTITEEGKYAVIFIKAVSYTWKLDIERKSRTFQSVSQTYRDVVKSVLRGYDYDLDWNVSDKQLEYPLIQYDETDYHFLKRILSYIGTGVITRDTSAKIHFSAGVKANGNKKRIDLNKYSYSLISDLRGQAIDGMKKCLGYEIKDIDDVAVGDGVNIQGKNLMVMETEAALEGGILNCSCRVFQKESFEKKRIAADNLKGNVLTGIVLEAKQETVKMRFDIDREQENEEAYAFPWRPITGNFLYCMPERGTRAALYFGEPEEKSAEVIYSIKENGEECEEFLDYEKRYFTTKESKRLTLTSTDMGLNNMTSEGGRVVLTDGGGVNIAANNQISILADGNVTLRGKRVIFRAMKEATIVRKDILMPAVVNLCRVSDSRWDYTTPVDIIKYTGFDAYRDKNAPYVTAEKYFENRSYQNEKIEQLIDIVIPVYRREKGDITQGAVLYYSPRAQKALHEKYPQKYKSVPTWDFSILEEIEIEGLGNDDFKFYKYK